MTYLLSSFAQISPPPHTLSASSSSVSLSILHSLILLFRSRTNCLPLRLPLPCHLATFLFSRSLRRGWQRANICMPSHVVCVIFCASCVPASIFSQSYLLIFSHNHHTSWVSHSWSMLENIFAIYSSLPTTSLFYFPFLGFPPSFIFVSSVFVPQSTRRWFTVLFYASWSAVEQLTYQLHQWWCNFVSLKQITLNQLYAK